VHDSLAARRAHGDRHRHVRGPHRLALLPGRLSRPGRAAARADRHV